jgi:hypothetical protein
MASTTSSANASDVGLIVQGTLIFLSAVVAIGGYYIQGRLKSKERQREVAIKRKEELHRGRLNVVRDKITRFVGPAHFLALTFNMNLFGLRTKLSTFYPTLGDETTQQIKDTQHSFNALMKGEWNTVTDDNFFGTTMMQALRNNPDSPASRHFRRMITVSFNTLLVPLSALIQQYAGFLQEWVTMEEFKQAYPCHGTLGRNEFPIQLLQFKMEMEQVVQDWDNGEHLDVLWTQQCGFPFQLGMYLIRMVTKLREMENLEGMASHALSDDGKVEKEATDTIDGVVKRGGSKYVAAASKE